MSAAGGGEARRPRVEREDGLRGVLLVHGDDATRRSLARGLERRGFAVIEAKDAADALAGLADGGIEVVATDADGVAPGAYGWLSQLARAWPGGSVCVMSSDRSLAEAVRHDRLGWRFLSQPTTAHDLAAVLDAMLVGRRWSRFELRGGRGRGAAPRDP